MWAFEASRRGRSMMDHGQCNAPCRGVPGVPGVPDSAAHQGPMPGPLPCLPCASNATNAPHVQSSSRRLPSLCSSPAGCHHPLEQWRGLASAMASHRATARALGVDWTALDIRSAELGPGWTKLDEAARELDEGSCGQASALSTHPAAQSCADQATDLPALLYAALHVVPLDTAFGTYLTCPTFMFPFSFRARVGPPPADPQSLPPLPSRPVGSPVPALT